MRQLFLLIFLSGCGSLTLRPAVSHNMMLGATALGTPVECDRMDSKYVGWTATTIVAGVLSGSSGLGSIFTESTPRYVVGGVGAGLAAITALSAFIGTHYAQRFTRLCSTAPVSAVGE